MNHSFQKWISRSVSVVAGLAFTAMVQADVVVDTQAGQLRGFEHDSRDVYVFKGVHYGQDTSGERRFKSALPVAWMRYSRCSGCVTISAPLVETRIT